MKGSKQASLRESERIESLKRMINLKDILIKHQQNEIEYIKKAIIADKFNDLLVYVTPEEKEALATMRQFDLQMKVVQDYERQELLVDNGQYKKGEEHQYLKAVNEKIGADLINIREVFQTSPSLDAQGNGKYQVGERSLKGIDFRDYFQKWLIVARDLIQSQFETEKCKSYLEALNQEIPILISIMTSPQTQDNDDKAEDQTAEVTLLKLQNEELAEEIKQLNKANNELKDKCSFFRGKVQELSEHNILLKKFLHTKPAQAHDFKRFYKQDLLTENASLKSKLLSLTPYNEKLSLECGTLRYQVNELQSKLVKQDERHLTEQELVQTLEQTLLETQRKFIEKDGEVVSMLKQEKDKLLKGAGDKALELLLTTAEALNKECMKQKEIVWTLENALKEAQRELEVKSRKINESKSVLSSYRDQLRQVTIENERMKVRLSISDNGIADLQKLDMASIPKEKLIYDLGGKDGANAALKFIETYSQQRDDLNRLIHEVASLKVENSNLKLLAEDKQAKLIKAQENLKVLAVSIKEKDHANQKLEHMNQKLQDDYLVQQQTLDVYVTMAMSKQGEGYENTLKKSIENGLTLASLLLEASRQRAFYYEQCQTKARELHLANTRMQLIKHQNQFLSLKGTILNESRLSSDLLEVMNNGILARYEKEVFLIHNFIQDSALNSSTLMLLQGNGPSSIQENHSSPSKIKPSVIDSPNLHSNNKKGLLLQNPSHQAYSQSQSIHHLTLTTLQINKLKSAYLSLKNDISHQRQQGVINQALLSVFEAQNATLMVRESKAQAKANQSLSDFASLKMQNLHLCRWSLYANRAHIFPSLRVTEGEQNSVQTLMSQQIDKLRIENSMLEQRTVQLEDQVSSFITSEKTDNNPNKVKIRTLQYDISEKMLYIARLEQELLSKQAQIYALSKVHNDFTAPKNTTQAPINSQGHSQSNFSTLNEGVSEGGMQQMLGNMRQEYTKLEEANQKLHEKIYMLETRNGQKDQKITVLTSRIRDLEKATLLSSDPKIAQNMQSIETKGNQFSNNEQMNLDTDEVWKKFAELNNLKNSLYDINEDLRIEVSSFKTHFSRYEAQEFKNKKNIFESFQSGLYTQLVALKDERDLLLWQVGKHQQRLFEQGTEIQSLKEEKEGFMREVLSAKDREISMENELGNMREQLVNGVDQKAILSTVEGNRLRRERIELGYECSRLRREGMAMSKELNAAKTQRDSLIQQEFALKKVIIELKNEIVQMRVKSDMGEYQTLVLGKSPLKATPSKKDEDYKAGVERVKIYVEDLAVMRESLLKIEFRNIELEELYANKERQLDEAKQQVRDLQDHLRVYQNDSQSSISMNDNSQQQRMLVIDLQKRLQREKWSSKKLQERLSEQEPLLKELQATAQKYIEELREHQRIHAENLVMQKALQKAPKGDLEFYDSLKEKFLTQLSLYVDDITTLSRKNARLSEEHSALRDQVMSLTFEVESFDRERDMYKVLIDRITHQKVEEVDYFVNTQQHEEGLSKLEAHIVNQRKKLVQFKSQLDIAQSEKQLLQESLKEVKGMLRKVEKHTYEINSELTVSRGELMKLRAERDKHEQRIAFMWGRLDFQERLYHKLESFDNVSIEQVIKIYKDELMKVKRSCSVFKPAADVNSVVQDQTDSNQIRAIQLKMKIMESKQESSQKENQTLSQQLDEAKLHISLSELLRQTVGVSQQERETFQDQISALKEKNYIVQQKLEQVQVDRDQIADRVDFLEKQFSMHTNIPSPGGFVKMRNTNNPEGDQSELMRQVENVKLVNRELDSTNVALRQQVHELQMSLKYYEENAMSQRQNSSQATVQQRQARAITPVRIRDMQIKGNGGKLLKTSRVDAMSERLQQTIDVSRNNGEDQLSMNSSALQRDEIRLPVIGNSNYYGVEQQALVDLRLKGARNMTPLPQRPITQNSQNMSDQQPVRAMPMEMNKMLLQPINPGGLRSNNLSALQPSGGRRVMGQMNPSFETVDPDMIMKLNSRLQ